MNDTVRALPGLEAHEPVHLYATQVFMRDHSDALFFFWWMVFVTTCVVVIVRGILKSRVSR
jgi:hypothetical protein